MNHFNLTKKLENSSVVYPIISWKGEPECEEGLKLEVGINELLSRGLSTASKLKTIRRPLVLLSSVNNNQS